MRHLIRYAWIAGSAGLVAVVLILVYPLIIFDRYGRYVPTQWSRAASGTETVADLVRDLGPPTVDASVKGLKIWIQDQPWGERRLEVIYKDHDSLPDLVIYHVTVKHYISGGNLYNGVVGGTGAATDPWPPRTYPFVDGRLVLSKP